MKNVKYDVIYTNPLGHPGTLYGLESSSPQEACDEAPHWLAASSHWRPQDFKIKSAKISIYEDQNELCKNKYT